MVSYPKSNTEAFKKLPKLDSEIFKKIWEINIEAFKKLREINSKAFKKLWDICNRNRITTIAFASLGGLWATYQCYRLGSFSYLHFIRSSSLPSYKKRSKGAWGLVTGASDGIGKAFAEELLSRGFNVVLHGRNQKKLEGVRVQLLSDWPEREIRTLVHDASDCDPSNINTTVQNLKDLDLKILINNVAGGQTPIWVPLTEHEDDRTRLFLDLTARFPTEFTRLLLPQLIRDSPALIMNVGSFVSELPSPYISVYGAAKTYNKAWSRSLRLEMQVEEYNIEVIHVLLGMVSTSNDPRPESFFIPSARRMAKGALDKVGCGRDVVFGYWPHEIHCSLLTKILPAWIREKFLLGIVKNLREAEQRQLRAVNRNV